MNKESYNKIVAHWVASRHQSEVSRLVGQFTTLVDPGGAVLDLGCGTGVPIARFLQKKGFWVTGVDQSERMIDIARQQVPDGVFLLSDINVYTSETQFVGIIAWDSLFHLEPEAQRKVYQNVYALLKSGGYFLFTSGNVDGEHIDKMYGASFYYGSIEAAKLRAFLNELGFEIVFWEEDYVEGDMDRALIAMLKK